MTDQEVLQQTLNDMSHQITSVAILVRHLYLMKYRALPNGVTEFNADSREMLKLLDGVSNHAALDAPLDGAVLANLETLTEHVNWIARELRRARAGK